MSEIETWKPIPNYEFLYQASSLGSIRSFDKIVNMKQNINYLKKGKLLSPALSKKSQYFRIKLSAGDCGYETLLVHRLIALTFIPNPDNLPEINHINGIKTDNRVENLEWITRKENIAHAYRTGLRIAPFGENACTAKLTEKEVLEIKCILASNRFTQVQIAEMYGVKKSAIGYINVGINWKHLNKESA